MSYDPKCYELAELFLSENNLNSEKNIDALAQLIQDEIESYIDNVEEQ